MYPHIQHARCAVPLCLILMLCVLKTTSTPDAQMRSSNQLENVRARLRRLWLDFVTRSKLRHSTEIKLSSVVFYKTHYGMEHAIGEIHPYQKTCIDKQPSKGDKANTCEKQRMAGRCEARLSGIIKDGLCARTCGLCGVGNVGMRVSFDFRPNKKTKKHKLVTLGMQPTGHWRLYSTYNDTGVGMHCKAYHFSSLTTNTHRLHK